MKKFSIIVFTVLCSFAVKAQTWNVDKAHSNVSFSITHLMLSEVSGKFKSYDAKFTSVKADFSDAVFEFTAQVSSLDTDNDMRNGHLQGEAFFDGAKYPTISFKSTSFKLVAGKKYIMLGNLTMKGKTLPVTLDVTLNGPVTNPRSQKLMIGLKATSTVDRTAYGISDMPAAALSHEVEIVAAGEFIRD